MASPSTNPLSQASADLVPFVPRLTLEWLRDEPAASWREVEGTLAFIDISGFTAMSERLSGLGRAGAEEVTEVMNATFAALLGVAYAQGGGLLKFGGDALLLLYDGEEHARRAARAAFEMRRTLRAIGRPRTSAGAIQLKMHAGLHSGRFQFFLVGESHRELLIAGPAATRTVEMEGTSEAGEILVSTETGSVLDADTLAEEKGDGRLLRSAPEVRGSVAPLPAIEGIPLEVAVPAPLRAQLLEIGPLEGEHRHAAIAFIRFAGTDEIIETEGPEAAADALDALVRAVQTAADEHRVTFLESDIDRDGGRIILVSGAPQTFGDDEERMLRTVRAIVDGGLPLPVHVGVSEGRVFTGQVGASFRRTYTVLGDTAALAARLMARAGEDEIWVSAGALTRGGGSFEATELEPLSLKGKAEPVQAFVLGELLAAPETPEPSDRSGRASVRRPGARTGGARRIRRTRADGLRNARRARRRAGHRKVTTRAGTKGELRRHASDRPALRAVRGVDPVLPVPPVPPLVARRPAERRRRAQSRRPRRAPAADRRGARAVGTAARCAARRRGRVHPGGRTISTLRSGGRACTASWGRSSATSSTRRRCSSSTTCTGWTTRRRSCCGTSERNSPRVRGSRARRGVPARTASRPRRAPHRCPR